MLTMTVSPIIDFGNGFYIDLSTGRWPEEGFRAAIAANSGGGKSHLTREKLAYFISDLDLHLKLGKTPLDALAATVEDYAFVFHSDDGRPEISRAAEVALKQLNQDKRSDNQK